MDNERIKIVTEEVNELMCEKCPFSLLERKGTALILKCDVPLGTCAYRTIFGLPGHFVGDLLEQAGLIKPGWDSGIKPMKKEDLRVNMDTLREDLNSVGGM